MKKRKVFYPAGVALASVASFLCIYISKTNYFGIPMGIYDAQYLITGQPPQISVSVYEILFALQIGFITVLLFWLVETLLAFIKSKKSA